MPGYTEAKHYYVFDATITAADGVLQRVRLGLAPDEVASVMQINLHMTPNGVTQFFQAVSSDPDEEANIGDHQVYNDQKFMVVRAFELLGVVGGGPIVVDTLIMPLPGGMDVAGDVVYLAGVNLDVFHAVHGCSVYYRRRKAKPGEREAIIMAQR